MVLAQTITVVGSVCDSMDCAYVKLNRAHLSLVGPFEERIWAVEHHYRISAFDASVTEALFIVILAEPNAVVRQNYRIVFERSG